MAHERGHAHSAEHGALGLLEREHGVEAIAAVEREILLQLEQPALREVADDHLLFERIGLDLRQEQVGVLVAAEVAQRDDNVLHVHRAVVFPHDVAVDESVLGAGLQHPQLGEPLEVAAGCVDRALLDDLADGLGVPAEQLGHALELRLAEQVALERAVVVGQVRGIGIGEEVPRVHAPVDRAGIAVLHQHVGRGSALAALGIGDALPPSPRLARRERTLEDAGAELAGVIDHVPAD